MTDNFEKAVQQIALKSADNGGPTMQDILTCLKATNDDMDIRFDELRSLLIKQSDMAQESERKLECRIGELERWREEHTRETCDLLTDRRQTWLMWTVGSKVTWIILSIGIGITIVLLELSLRHVLGGK